MLPVKFIRNATSYFRKSTIVAIDHSYQVVGVLRRHEHQQAVASARIGDEGPEKPFRFFGWECMGRPAGAWLKLDT
jgi:hypothetical protein